MEVNIRKQGGAAILTIPSDVMKLLSLKVGAKLSLEVIDGDLIIHVPKAKERKRYTLEELLVGTTPESLKKLNQVTAHAREGRSVGREL